MFRFIASRRSKGQGMTEYIIIIVLVAVLVLGVVLGFGKKIRNLFVSSSKHVQENAQESEGLTGQEE